MNLKHVGSFVLLSCLIATLAACRNEAVSEAAGLGSGSTEAQTLRLNPENSTIEFIGTHANADPDPNPRTGWFERFSGEAQVDFDNRQLRKVQLVFDTGSVTTSITNLTNHLRNPDFFDSREFPEARFVTTQIAPGEERNQLLITGDLTILENTRSVQMPATVEITDDELRLDSTFEIKRSEFGMTRLMDRVDDEINLTVQIRAHRG